MAQVASLFIAHPCLRAGGSEARVLWSITGLKESYDISVVTGCPIDMARLNQHCGTAVRESDFSPIVAPQWPRRIIGHTDALRGAVFARFCRSVAKQFDVCISGYNVMDFGKPAIQFVADFSFDDGVRQQYDSLPTGLRQWMHRPGWVRRGYLGLTRAISGRSGYDGSQDCVVANSQWTAGLLRSKLGLDSDRVIYPPVVADSPALPWEQRDLGFVVLGRVSYEKRIDSLIEVLGRVRAAGYDVRLQLIGGIADDTYGRMIRKQISANSSWCLAHGARVGVEKMALLARNRFAIHGRQGEAFGIAVAEQVKAGCIPFVPREGGPAEIVGIGELTYDNKDEAVSKIVGVLEDPKRQQDLRAHLARRAALFSTERFISDVRSLVDEWVLRWQR